MLSTKLFKLLRNLSPEEMKAIRGYLLSRHKSTSKLFKLFKYIDGKHPNLKANEKKLSREKIYKSTFGTVAFNRGKIDELTSRLLKAIESFLIANEVEEDSLLRDVLLNKVLGKRGIDDLFKIHNSNIQNKIRKNKTLEQAHYHALFQLSNDFTFHRDTPKIDVGYNNMLVQTEGYLDMYYVLHKLKIICERTTLGSIVQTDDVSDLLIIDFEKVTSKIPHSDLVNLYLQIIEMYETNDTAIYDELKEKITNKNRAISTENRYTLIGFLINFCNKKYKENKKKEIYISELFGLYSFAEKNKLLIENGYIAEYNYLNIIKIAVAAKKFDYVKKLIKYADQLKPEYKENGYALASAIFHFAKKEYEITQSFLHEVDWKNINYKLTSTCLLIRTYYELSEYKALKYCIENARRFVKRNIILSEGTKTVNLNFFSFVAELTKQQQKSTPKIEVLLQQLERPIVYIEWCQQKLEELRK